MRALIFSQHFAPELTAGRFRIEAFANGLLARGHEVEVVCPVPNHPAGVVDPAYRGRVLSRRLVDGVQVNYVWVRTGPVKTLLSRALYYGSYAALATAVGAIARRPDVVLATSPPLPVGAAAALVATRHRVPWLLDVRDIWPEVAITLGELTDPRLIGILSRLERRLYRSAACVTTVTEPFQRDIAARTPQPRKVELIPNGTTRVWVDAGQLEVDRASVGLPKDRFVWTYAGNVGLSHRLEIAIEAAALLGEGFQLVVMGEGPRRAALEEQASGLPPGAAVFRPLTEPEAAARVLRASDALLVTQRGDLTKVVSSKLYDCCAIGRPVVAVAEGEMRRLVEEAGIGIGVPAEDPKALASSVRRLREDPGLRATLAERGRAFAAEHLRERQAKRLAELAESVALDGR
jgi:putative colanic acid biosynthesis glycosyltransferase WcaI